MGREEECGHCGEEEGDCVGDAEGCSEHRRDEKRCQNGVWCDKGTDRAHRSVKSERRGALGGRDAEC